jgi:GNAT superfamily N-acetyltransferase
VTVEGVDSRETNSPDLRRATSPEVTHAEAAGQLLRRGPYRVLRLRQPGRLLLPEAQAELLEMIIRESSVSFGGDMRSYWEQRPRYFHELSEWWLAHLDGEVVGWHGFAVWDHPDGAVAYYDSLNVMPAHRRTSIGSILTVEPYLRLVSLRAALPAIALRTESPVVYRMLRRFVSHAYPIGARRHDRNYARAQRAASYAADRLHRGEGFDPNTFVVREALRGAGDLYGKAPPDCGDDVLDQYFERHVQVVERGDAMLAIGLLNWPGVMRAAAALGAILVRLRFERGSTH